MGKIKEQYIDEINKLQELLKDYSINYNDKFMVEIEDLDKLSNLKPFVKWLVESDKLDAIKLKIHPHYYNEVSHKSGQYSFYEQLVMLLAISNDPINDLIYMFK